MNRTHHTPATIAPPASQYVHGVQIEGASRWLICSGQIGTEPGGRVAGDSRAQMRSCWQRLLAILEDAGMSKTHIVKVTGYLTDAGDVGLYREVRDEMLGIETASTLVVVAALAHPDWTVEIELTAAA